VSADGPPLRGRQAEALRNDDRILAAALDVFSEDVGAPMSAVARRAGVGQASLYRRYPRKETLLARVCEHGMTQMGAAAAAARDDDDPGAALGRFLHWLVESGTLRLSGLLGSFAPPAHLFTLAHEVNGAVQALVDRAAGAGRLRPGVTGADLTLIASQIGALHVGDAPRTRELRRRYLALALEGLALARADPLPGPAPGASEL